MISRFGEFEIDAALFELRRAGRRIAIEPKAFDLLSYLVRHSQRVVTRDEIFAAVWPNEFVSDSALAYAVKAVRRAIGDDGQQQRLIRTVQRRGFRLLADVVPSAEPAAPSADAAAPAPAVGFPFVGRERELADLITALDAATSGAGGVHLVSGEAGIGKTRLVNELAAVVAARGARVLVGRCYEGDGAPAYAPWMGALGAYARGATAADLVSDLADNAADVAALVPEIRERLAHLPPLPLMDPERARYRLFDGVARFLARAAQRAPIVLVLDDLHWADHSSLLLLQFVARDIAASRVLAVGTHRDLLLPRDHPLAQALGGLARVEACRRLALSGLGAAEVGAFVRAVAGVEPPAALVATIHRDTDGNPFFVSELVRVLAASAALDAPLVGRPAIPATVRQAIAGHLGAVSSGCARALDAAAVIGREFEVPLLAEVLAAELPPAAVREAVLKAIDEALAIRLIEPVDALTAQARLRRYRFVHSLVREVVYDGLGAGRQARLHELVGEALERRAPDLAPASELAHHFANAGAADRAVDYACAAAEQASAVMAYEEAAASYELALSLLGSTAEDAARRCRLLLALAWSRWQANDAAAARRAAQEAATLARALESPELFAEAALSCGDSFRGFQMGIHDPELVALLEAALAGLGKRASGLRGRVMARLAVALYHVGGSAARRTALSDDSLRVSRRARDGAAELAALYGRHWAIWGPDTVADRLQAAGEMVRLAERRGDAEMSFHAHRFRFMDLLEQGVVPPLDRELAVCDQLAGQLRQPYYRWYVDTFLALRAFLAGRFAECEALAQRAAAVGQQAQNQNVMQIFGIQMFTLRREQGRLGELRDAIRGFITAYPNIPGWHAALVLVCAETGDAEGARAELEYLAVDDFAGLPRDSFWLGAMAGLGDVCAILGDGERAALLYALLRPFETQNVALAPGAACNGFTGRVLGRLSATLGQWDRAQRHFERALQRNGRLGAPQFVAHTQTQYADMLQARGAAADRARVAALREEAQATYRRLGMPAAAQAKRPSRMAPLRTERTRRSG